MAQYKKGVSFGFILIEHGAGAVPVWGGLRHLGEGAKIAVFSQDLAQVSFLYQARFVCSLDQC